MLGRVRGAGGGDGKQDDQEEECAICLEVLVDPLAPCAEQPSHRYCRTCAQKMQRQKLPTCPLCRGKMQDAEELFYQSIRLDIRAEKAQTPALRSDLFAKSYAVLHRVLRVDPPHTSAQYNLGFMSGPLYKKSPYIRHESRVSKKMIVNPGRRLFVERA